MREKVGSRAELARQLDVSPLTLSLWEQGEHVPRNANVVRIERLESKLARGGNPSNSRRRTGAKNRPRTGAKRQRPQAARPHRRSQRYDAQDVNQAVERLLEVLNGAAMKEVARIDQRALAELSGVLSSLSDIRARYEDWGSTPWTEVEVQ